MSTATNHAQEGASTTALHSAVGFTALVRSITESLLAPREKLLSRRAPRDGKVHQLRRDIKAGKMKPVETLLRIAFADLEDGVPLAAATQHLQEMLTACEAYASVARPRTGRVSALPFNQRLLRAAVRETKAQGVGDVDVQEAIANPEDPEVLRDAVMALQVHGAEEQELEAVLTEELVVIEATRG